MTKIEQLCNFLIKEQSYAYYIENTIKNSKRRNRDLTTRYLTLNSSFIWSETPQGRAYWSLISDKAQTEGLNITFKFNELITLRLVHSKPIV